MTHSRSNLHDARTIWYNIAVTDGLGPVSAQKICKQLDVLQIGIEVLLEQDSTWISNVLGLSTSLAESIKRSLDSMIDIPHPNPPVQLLVPGDLDYPNTRCMEAVPPLPPLLWAAGDLSRLSFDGTSIGIAGSRETTEDVLDLTRQLAKQASNDRVLVISGLAQGVDSAAHEGALIGRSGTIGVMASGINKHKGFTPTDDMDPMCFVSQFTPDEPWSGPRAMQRNSTIAAFSDRVVVMAAGKSGGTWEMGQLCLKKKKPLFVLDLDASVAEGNRLLIKAGAIPFTSDSLDMCWEAPVDADTQPSLFD